MKTPIYHALSLRYEPGIHTVPIVDICATAEETAEVIRLAKKYKIPIIDDPELARALALQEEGAEIPQPLYHAVAVILNELRNLLP